MKEIEHIIRVDDETWEWLQEFLERPERDLPRLREFLRQPSVFEED